MMKMVYRLLLATLLLACGAARADGASTLKISHPWIRMTPGAQVMAGYFSLTNAGSSKRVLTGVRSQAFANAMLHKSIEKDGKSMMLHVDGGVEVAPGQTVTFAPGGYHVMLMRPVKPLTVGDKVAVDLLFQDKSSLTALFDVQPVWYQGPGASGGKGQQ